MELVFTVYDAKGKEQEARFSLDVEHTPEEVRLVLIDTDERQNNIAISGSTVVLEGSSPINNRIEVFGAPVIVDGGGKFSADFILPAGQHDVPIHVYENGLDVMTHEIIDVQPTIVNRSFKSNDNFLVYSGFGEFEFGHTSYRGNANSLTPESINRLEDGIYMENRLAYYAKAKFLGKYHLTVSVDTDREKRELFTNLEPEDFYQTYGDDSKIEYDGTETQDEVFVHLEWDNSYVRYGNYGTGFTGTELADFNRTLHGFKLHYDSVETGFDDKAKTHVAAFYAQARQRAAHVEFQATGGSFYYLKHQDVISGSEKIKIEIRDKITLTPISEETLTEGTDYEIDYSKGRVKLTRPLQIFSSSTDIDILSTDLLSGDPQFLIVDYEYDTGVIQKDRTAGLRVSREWLPNLRIGGTLVQEEQELQDYKLAGIDAHLRIFDKIDIRAEAATSNIEAAEQFLSHDGGLSFAETEVAGLSTGGTGYKVSADGELWKGFNFDAFFQNIDKDFSSSGSIAQAGTQKYAISLEQLFGEWGSLLFHHSGEKLLDGGNAASQTQRFEELFTTIIQGSVQKGKFKAVAEYRQSSAAGIVGLINELTQNGREDEELIGVELSYDISEKTKIKTTAQKNLTGEGNSQIRTTLVQKLNDYTSLFATHVFGERGHGVLAGLDASIFGYPVSYQKALGAEGIFTQPTMQDMTLGFVRNLGKDAEVAASQTVGISGIGKRALSFKKNSENRSTALTYESEDQKDVYSFTNEFSVNKNVTTYTGGNWYRDRLAGQQTLTTVKGVKFTGLNDRLTTFMEDENTVFTGNKGATRRMGAGILFSPDWRMDLSYERTQAQTATEDTASQVAYARLEYLKYGIGNFYVDFEARDQDSAIDSLQLLSTGGGEVRLWEDLTISGRYEWSHTDDTSNGSGNGGTISSHSEYQIGMAYRPSKFDWINFLAEYKKIKEKSPSSQFSSGGISKEVSHVIRGEVAIDIGKHFTFVEKFALRRNQFNQADPVKTYLSAHRLNWHATDWLDLIVEYRMLKQKPGDSTEQGFLFEAVAGPFYGFRFGAGYNFVKYDTKLAADLDVEEHGMYGRLVYDPIETFEKATEGHEEQINDFGIKLADKAAGFIQKIPGI